ncbi:MAG TPA: ABC transporter transmembrane domain-containing protein [Saprospiraceae bacterium]|nr:ABC transporter transmembrane domain-containing protein [Saprospiraceae bacterium]
MAQRRFHDDDPDAPPLPKINGERLREAIQIFAFVRPYRWHLITGLFLLFLSSLVFMVFPFLSGQMIDIAQGKSEFNYTLKDVGWVLLGILLVQGFVSYTRVQLFAVVSEKGIADVRRALYEKMLSLPIVFFEKSRVGELVSRVTADVEKLYNTFSITLAEFVRQIIILVTGIVFLAFTTPKLALIMLATFPVIVVGAMIFGRFIRKLSKERQKALADSNIIVSETMSTIQVVKAFTNEFFEALRYGKSIDAVVKVSLKFAQGRAIFAVFIVTVLFGALFFIIWQGALMVQNGTITAGELVAFVSYTAIIGGAIAGLGNFYTELLGAIGATERIREILKDTSEVQVKNISEDAFAPLKGNVAYQNVRFRYPTREDVEVLKGLSFEVKAGQKVALVGPSGAGKSTIVQLLLKFYDIQDGDILVDGKSISEMETSDYRQNIAIVPQEVLLFGGTIRENIAYGKPDAGEAEIIEAARQSNCLEFIQNFPDGLNTVVGERGVKLSGGQRQRVAIARAILKNPAILLLDEATSSLDAESEKVVQEALNKLMEGRTSIIIAHRLATIREVDKIFVIDGGQIVESGTHEYLSSMDGLYNSLAKLQFESHQV